MEFNENNKEQKLIAKSIEDLELLIKNYIKNNREIKSIKKYCFGRVYYAKLIL